MSLNTTSEDESTGCHYFLQANGSTLAIDSPEEARMKRAHVDMH